jgi:hypothetical protein
MKEMTILEKTTVNVFAKLVRINAAMVGLPMKMPQSYQLRTRHLAKPHHAPSGV